MPSFVGVLRLAAPDKTALGPRTTRAKARRRRAQSRNRAGTALALLLALTATAGAETRVALPLRSGPPVVGYLSKPAGPGPFSAVALLHSCLGLPSDRRALAEKLTGAGFVALWVDDFTTRSLSETCSVDFPEALNDALGAYDYLARLPEVDPGRLAAVGFSQGGDTALKLATQAPGFRAAAAYYPPCANSEGERLKIPTLILVGSEDDVTPAADCHAFARGQKLARLIVLPGARHLFDDPAAAGGEQKFGMRFEYQAKAAERAQAALLSFLKEELGTK
jgi:dienelactone hydrolase